MAVWTDNLSLHIIAGSFVLLHSLTERICHRTRSPRSIVVDTQGLDVSVKAEDEAQLQEDILWAAWRGW